MQQTFSATRTKQMTGMSSMLNHKSQDIGKVQGLVRRVIDPLNFYVEFDLVDSLVYSKMDEELQTTMDRGNFSNMDVVREGQFYATFYEERWRRIVINRMVSNWIASVFFIDCGYQDSLDLSCLRMIDKRFLRIPARVTLCQLNGIQFPGHNASSWSNESCLFFESLILNARVTAFIVETFGEIGGIHDKEFKLDVKLFKHGYEVSVNDMLTKSGHALDSQVTEQFWDSEVQSSCSVETDDSSHYDTPCPSTSGSLDLSIEAECGSQLSDSFINCVVSVSHVVDPSHFYVHRSSDFDHLHVINQLIAEASGSGSDSSILRRIQSGSLYLVLCPTTQSWYRSRCVSSEEQVSQGFSHDYLLIDVGRTVRVFKKYVRRITDQLGSFPPMAVACTLNVPSPIGGWPCSAVAHFKQLVDNRLLDMTFLSSDGQVFKVDLMQRTSIEGEKVVDSIAAIFNDPPKLEYKFVALKKGTWVQGKVARCFSPSYFYIVLDSHKKEKFAELSDQLQSEMNDDDSECSLAVRAPQPGQAYAARLGRIWHRVLLVRPRDDGYYFVFLVDTGRRENVQLTDLRQLHPKYVSCPTRAIRCKLHNVRPRRGGTSWSEKSNLFFQTELQNCQRVTAHVTHSFNWDSEPFKEKCFFVNMFVDDEETSINKFLVSTGFAESKFPSTKSVALHSSFRRKHRIIASHRSVPHRQLRKRTRVLTAVPISKPAAKAAQASGEGLTLNSLTTEVTILECPPHLRPEMRNSLKTGTMPLDADFVVAVRFLMCKSSDCVYVRPLVYDAKFEQLQADLQVAYCHPDMQPVDRFFPGSWCAAFVYGKWIRAAMVDLDEQLICSIVCLDSGLPHQIPIHQTFRLLEPFSTVPKLAIRCSLAGVRGGDEVASQVTRTMLSADEIFVSCHQRPKIIPSLWSVSVVIGKTYSCQRSGSTRKYYVNLNEELK